MPLTDPRLEAARLMDTDEPVGVHGWPIACYVSEAIENELAALGHSFPRPSSYDYWFRRAINRAANCAGSYAEQWGLDPLVFRAAVDLRR